MNTLLVCIAVSLLFAVYPASATAGFMNLMERPVMSVPSVKLLDTARVLFYKSLDDENKLAPAIEKFQELMKRHPEFKGRATTYIGALTAVKAKHAFWPHQKMSYANDGLAIMDKGRKLSPDDIEALFIHASTCYYLPFFFNRGNDAQSSFLKLSELLPERHKEYDPNLIHNVIEFLLQKAELPEDKNSMLQALKSTLPPKSVQ